MKTTACIIVMAALLFLQLAGVQAAEAPVAEVKTQAASDNPPKAVQQTKSDGSGSQAGNYSSGGSKNSSCCWPFRVRYNQFKKNRDSLLGYLRQAEATVEEGGDDTEVQPPAAPVDERIVNKLKVAVKAYEREMAIVARQAKRAGCSVE
jgi:hypothetical protein